MSHPPSDQLIKHDRLACLLGIHLLELSHGRARVGMTATADHCNGLGIVHGATLFALADVAFAAACNSHGHPTVGINANISYIKAAKPGLLIAEARQVVNAKVGLCEVQITDEKGDLLASFQGPSYQNAHDPRQFTRTPPYAFWGQWRAQNTPAHQKPRKTTDNSHVPPQGGTDSGTPCAEKPQLPPDLADSPLPVSMPRQKLDESKNKIVQRHCRQP